MKKLIAAMLIVAMLLNSTAAITYGTADSEMSDFDYAKAVMAQIMDINKELHKIGLNIEDLRRIPIKDPSFYEELKRLLNEENAESNPQFAETLNVVTSDTNSSSSEGNTASEESINTAEMWGYAYEMAILNKNRDSNAKDLVNEAKYMYMSHYIDIRTGPIYQVDKSKSEGSYLSAWITNDDRQAYNTYISGAKHGSHVHEFANAAINILSLGSTLKDATALPKLNVIWKEVILIVATAGNIELIKEGLSNVYSNFISIVSEEGIKAPNFVHRINKMHELKDYDKQTQDSIKSIIFSLMVTVATGNLLAIPTAIGLNLASFVSYAIKDFYDKIWWTALIRYNSMRVTNRILRYYGF